MKWVSKVYVRQITSKVDEYTKDWNWEGLLREMPQQRPLVNRSVSDVCQGYKQNNRMWRLSPTSSCRPGRNTRTVAVEPPLAFPPTEQWLIFAFDYSLTADATLLRRRSFLQRHHLHAICTTPRWWLSGQVKHFLRDQSQISLSGWALVKKSPTTEGVVLLCEI